MFSDLSRNEERSHLNQSSNTYLGRWHLCLELFGRVFINDVGSEPYSILNELGRFDVKETKFKREMEKLRTAHPKDLYLEGVMFYMTDYSNYYTFFMFTRYLIIVKIALRHVTYLQT